MVRSAMAAREGALFTSLTVTVKLLVTLSGGVPSSVTTTAITLTEGACDSAGVQEIAPVEGTMVIPEGGARRLKVRVLAGRSESVADAETFRIASSLMV